MGLGVVALLFARRFEYAAWRASAALLWSLLAAACRARARIVCTRVARPMDRLRPAAGAALGADEAGLALFGADLVARRTEQGADHRRIVARCCSWPAPGEA